MNSTSISSEATETGTLTLTVDGRLDSTTTGKVWRKATKILEQTSPAKLVIDATKVDYCDESGIGLFIELQRRQTSRGGKFGIIGLNEESKNLLDFFDPSEFEDIFKEKALCIGFPKEIGRTAFRVYEDICILISFVGEFCVALLHAVRKPSKVRWRDSLLVAEKAGVNALPIIALISFLVGLISAFQAAIPMQQFGVEIYVANLVALSMLRELGPLMTAIVLAGRSGSAFAAEIGTMKVNEEIDALTTMGLDPVRFLVIPRVTACLFMTPLLTIFANLLGLLGGFVVLLSMGYPPISYFNQVISAVTYIDLTGGLIKSLVFGFLVAGIGCLRGLQTKTGASAVGDSTTGAVVSSITLIVITDGLFSIIYYILGI